MSIIFSPYGPGYYTYFTFFGAPVAPGGFDLKS